MSQMIKFNDSSDSIFKILYSLKQDITEQGYLTSPLKHFFEYLEQNPRLQNPQETELFIQKQMIIFLDSKQDILQQLYLINALLDYFDFQEEFLDRLATRIIEALREIYSKDLSFNDYSLNLRIQAWNILDRIGFLLKRETLSQIKSLSTQVRTNSNEDELIKKNFLAITLLENKEMEASNGSN